MTYAYDKLNRLVTVTDSYKKIISSKVYDANENVIKEIDAEGYLSGNDNDSRYGTLYTYDLANRLIKKSTPEAAAKNTYSIKYEYNQYGEAVKQTDSLGNATAYEYDAAGRLTKVTDPLEIATKYSYDKQGSKLTMTDGRSKLTRYSYTAFGSLKTVINPDSKVMSYKYDLSGNTACVTDKNGNNTIYTYDNLGLLLERKVLETADSIKYTYDQAGNRTAMEDESGISAYTYDKNGRRDSITYDGGVSEKYTYDKDNQLTQLANKKPNGSSISEYKYIYDLAGRQLSKTDSYGTTSYEYDRAGRITKVTAPGKTTVYAYDKAGNRVSLNETYTSLQPSEYIDEGTGKDIQYILKKSDYTYSNSNTLLKLVERMLDENNKELARKTTKYVYDDNGNQLRQSVSHILPDNTKLRPATKGAAYGDNITGGIDKLVEKTSYTYDGFNRLKKTETVKASIRTTAEYTYNGDDLRVSKTVKKSDNGYTAEITNYLYDRQNVILETDAKNNIKASYIKGINYIAKTDAQNNTAYFLFNGHGDVVQTVDEAGTIQNQYDYDIWGNPTLTIETSTNAIRYSGEFMDSETGLYYLRARYYDPSIGRFISEDSYWGEDENPLSLNLYTYCANDPIRYTDPSGHYYNFLTGGDDGKGPVIVTGVSSSGVVTSIPRDTTPSILDLFGIPTTASGTDSNTNSASSGNGQVWVRNYLINNYDFESSDITFEQGHVHVYDPVLESPIPLYIDGLDLDDGMSYAIPGSIDTAVNAYYNSFDKIIAGMQDAIKAHKKNSDALHLYTNKVVEIYTTNKDLHNKGLLSVEEMAESLYYWRAFTTELLEIDIKISKKSTKKINDTITKQQDERKKMIEESKTKQEEYNRLLKQLKAGQEKLDKDLAELNKKVDALIAGTRIKTVYHGETCDIITIKDGEGNIIEQKTVPNGYGITNDETSTTEGAGNSVSLDDAIKTSFNSEWNKNIANDKTPYAAKQLLPKEMYNIMRAPGERQTLNALKDMYGKDYYDAAVQRNFDENMQIVNGLLLVASLGTDFVSALEYNMTLVAKISEVTASVGKGTPKAGIYIPKDANGNPIPLAKQRINGQDIPLPDPAANGSPHTVLGGKVSSSTGETYRQSSAFPGETWPKANGKDVPWSEVHWSNHGRGDHGNPHQHIFTFDGKGWFRGDPTDFNK